MYPFDQCKQNMISYVSESHAVPVWKLFLLSHGNIVSYHLYPVIRYRSLTDLASKRISDMQTFFQKLVIKYRLTFGYANYLSN